MKNRIYIVLVLGVAIAFASEGIIEAQSAGGQSKVEPPVAPQATSRIKMLRKTSGELTKRVENLLGRRKHMLAEFREKSISDISFEEVFRMLNVQKVQLAIELEGLRARLNVLEEKLRSPDPEAEVAAKLREEAAKIQIELTQQRFATTTKLFKKGARSQSELDTAKHDLALAQLQFEASKNAAGPSAELVKAMFEVSLEIAEKTAKQSAVEKMLKNYVDSRDDYIELKDLSNAIEDAMDWGMQLNRLMATPELMDAQF